MCYVRCISATDFRVCAAQRDLFRFARPMPRPDLNENLLVFNRFLNILPSRTRRERYARGAAEGYAASAPAAQAPFERRQR